MNETVIATIAPLVSSIMAFISWWYGRELSKAAISMVDVKVSGQRVAEDKLGVDFLFLFKNVGKETLRIRELRLGYIEFNRKVFEIVGRKPIFNPIQDSSEKSLETQNSQRIKAD